MLYALAVALIGIAVSIVLVLALQWVLERYMDPED